MNIPVIPDSYDAPILASIRDIIAACGGDKDKAWKLIVKITSNFTGDLLAESFAKELLRQVTTTGDAPEKPEPVKPAVDERLLRSVAWSGFPKIKFDAPVIETWPKEGAKNICGVLYLNGGKCEHVAAGRQWSSVVNAITPGKYYRPEFHSGLAVNVQIRSNDGKRRTNELPIIWP